MKTNILRAGALALVMTAAAAAAVALAQGPGYVPGFGGGQGYGPGMMGAYEGWGWWGAHMLSSLLFWVLAIGAVVFLVRWFMASQRPEAGPRAETALDILKKRYASGEVEREEFELKRRDLQA